MPNATRAPSRSDAAPAVTRDASGARRALPENWMLTVLVALEAAFALTLMLVGHRSPADALWLATGATMLAMVATYLRPATLAIGARMGLARKPRAADVASIPASLVVVAAVEMATLLLATLAAGLDTMAALELAAAITALALKVLYGRAVLVAIGRRLFTDVSAGR